MTDYLEELLDQLEEEEAGTAARWPEGQAPAWAESPGCAALWEEDVAARYLEGQYRQCPYFRPGDDYTVVRHQN